MLRLGRDICPPCVKAALNCSRSTRLGGGVFARLHPISLHCVPSHTHARPPTRHCLALQSYPSPSCVLAPRLSTHARHPGSRLSEVQSKVR
eukprot:351131-Chlamydomonas_euryale.AAC.2